MRGNRHWSRWVMAVQGVVAILFGIAAFLWPGPTLEGLVLLFGLLVLFTGLGALAAAFTDLEAGHWWAHLVGGLVGIGFGIVALLWPGVTLLMLVYLAALWALVTGVLRLIAAIRHRGKIEPEWGSVTLGILAVVLAMALLVWPRVSIVVVTWLVGGYAILAGTLLLVLTFRKRRHSDEASPPPHLLLR
jgi:uncharacterized membrane protein HdeD (DUF308 family)